MRPELTCGHATLRGMRIAVVDCTSWRIHQSVPECGLGRDLATCATCEARTSRNGDLRDPPIIGRPRGAAAPPPPPRRIMGLGDAVAAVTEATGIAKAVHRLTGGKCGCGKRREALNRLVPFKGAETAQEPSAPSPPPETAPDDGSPQAGA